MGSCWEWLSKTDKRFMILTVPEHCTLEASASITTAFANEFDLYSPSLFATYDRMITNHAL